MIYAIACAKDDGPIIRPMVSLDFVGGTYEVSGLTQTAADVVDKPLLISSPGLQITAGAGNQVAVIGAALAAMVAMAAADFCIVMEWSETTPNDVVVFESSSSFGNKYVEFWNISNGTELDLFDWNNVGTVGDLFTLWASIPATKRAAANYRRAGSCALSLNGLAMVSRSTGGVAMDLDTVTLGGFHGTANMAGHIRKLVMMPSVDDTALPSLSTL